MQVLIFKLDLYVHVFSMLVDICHHYEELIFPWRSLSHTESNILTNDQNVIYIVAEKYTVNIFLSHLFIIGY
jgi:hypothetical protein